MFDALMQRFGALDSLTGRLSAREVEAILKSVRMSLLEADVSPVLVRETLGHIKSELNGQTVSGLTASDAVIASVGRELIRLLGTETTDFPLEGNVLLAGLQGAGKTSLAGKLAALSGKKTLLVGLDLLRPAAAEQLSVMAKRSGAEVEVARAGDTVQDVAKRALQRVENEQFEFVVFDTAGRVSVDFDLMREAKELRDMVGGRAVLVLDAMTGQDAVETARAFKQELNLDGAVLTKMDGDTRGGAALSLAEDAKLPIVFASTGEHLLDIEVFHPDRMANRILGMGDILTLVEKAERTSAETELQRAESALNQRDFTLNEFLDQVRMVQRMGPIAGVLSRLPNMSELGDAVNAVDDKTLRRVSAIIGSMTEEERNQPELLTTERMSRIGKGAGVSSEEVRALIERFLVARKTMYSMWEESGRSKPEAKSTAPRSSKTKRKNKSKKR